MYFVGTVLTAGGFLIAIFSVFEIIDRPGDIEEILFKATKMIEEDPEPVDNSFVLLVAEYPLIGSLSVRETSTYDRFKDVLTKAIENRSARSKVVIPANWEQVLEGYANEFQLDKEIFEAAKNDNSQFIARLGDAVIHKVKSFAKYQALIVGTEENGRRTPSQGIVFFAIRSEVTWDHGIAGTQQEKSTVGSLNKHSKPRPVYILAWKTRDPTVLDDIVRLADLEIRKTVQPQGGLAPGGNAPASSGAALGHKRPGVVALGLGLLTVLLALLPAFSRAQSSKRKNENSN